VPAADPISTQTGEFVLVQVVVPGIPAENAGVLLLDPSARQPFLRFRRDLPELSEDDADILEELQYDLENKGNELGGLGLLAWLEENASNFVRITDREQVLVDNYERTLNRLYSRHIAPKVLPFRTHLPMYSARAAAGKFGERMEVESEGWIEAPERLRLTDDMFVAHVTGRSMEPRIPDGSLCVFRANPVGSRQNKLVLVMNYGEPGENRFTIKRYKSSKRQTEEGWEHERILLEPLNPEFEPWELEEGSIRIVGEFIQVLENEE
jgi:SOS-response transcriptional repressor LexA